MFSLTIVFGPSPVPWVLLFKTSEAANTAVACAKDATATDEAVIISDDYGQHVQIRGKAIHGYMLEDMELSKLAHIEQGLHRARTQAKAQTMASADPVLKAAAMMGGAPMLSPGFNGGGGAFRGQ